MRLSHYFYLDGTFLSTKEFYQILILMYYDENSCKKVPGSYILINNKLFKGYTIALNAFKRILTGEDKIPINLYSITTDFEVSLIEEVQNVFPKSRIVGCMFHYIKQLRLLLSKYGLFISEYENTTNELFKALSKSPFVFHNNKNYIENTFIDYLKNSIDENHKNLILKFKKYYFKQWMQYFENNILNYKYLTKIQRTNSYIENYNKRIRDILGKFLYNLFNIGPYLNRKGVSIIPWPLYLSFIISEEDLYKNILIKNDNDIKKITIEANTDINLNENEDSLLIDKSKIKRWLYWKDLSCRYDTFLFLQLYLLNYLIHKYNLSININVKKLYDLVESIDNIPEVEYKKGFWTILENYLLDNINALTSENGYKDFFPIEHIFRFLNENNAFCIKIK